MFRAWCREVGAPAAEYLDLATLRISTSRRKLRVGDEKSGQVDGLAHCLCVRPNVRGNRHAAAGRAWARMK